MKMAGIQVIENIVKEVEKMIAEFEKLIKEAISSLKGVAETTAGEIKTVSKEIFTNVRTKMSNAIQSFKNVVDSKKIDSTSPGVSSSTFTTRVHNMLHTLIDDLQAIFDRVKEAVKSLLSDTRTAIKDVESKLSPAVTDTTDFVDTTAKDFLSVLKSMGSDAETAISKGATDVTHNVELDASFIKKHGLQIAEVATISIINPFVIGSFVVSGGMIYYGATYEA